MILLQQVPESAMVAAFLKAELSSPRFCGELKLALEKLGVGEMIVARPDLQNRCENELRARVLGDYRGYKQNDKLFADFPDDLKWYKAKIPRDEIARLQYVDYSYWNELTDHTRLVGDAVRNILKGRVVFEVSNDRFLAVADEVSRGEHCFEPIILWGESERSSLRVLEGHLRATALGLAGEDAPEVINAIVGLKNPN